MDTAAAAPEHHVRESERYELDELLPGRPAALYAAVKAAGIVALVVLLGLALAYPFRFL